MRGEEQPDPEKLDLQSGAAPIPRTTVFLGGGGGNGPGNRERKGCLDERGC